MTTSANALGLSGSKRNTWQSASPISFGALHEPRAGEDGDRKNVGVEDSVRSEVQLQNGGELPDGASRSWENSHSSACSVQEVDSERSEQLVELEGHIERDEVPSVVQLGEMSETTHFGITPPLPLYELDRIQKDIDLRSFGEGLQKAAEAIFPNDNRSRYTEVHVLLLSWEDEDPNLPVSIDISRLSDLLQTVYGFETSAWQIPAIQSHRETNRRIDQFLGDDDPKHLKIVYYAGHGRLTSSGQLAWTSQRNSANERCPTVKWSGIQSNLEEAQSDVLLLLDCCAAGTANTNEGNGVTELLAACAFNGIANGVGPYSFTHALINQLRLLSSTSSFSTAILFNRLYTEIEGWRLIGKDFQRPPVHLVLSQEAQLPRSIQLSPRRSTTNELTISTCLSDQTSQDSARGHGESLSTESQTSSSSEDIRPLHSDGSDGSSNTSNTSLTLETFPRLLFSVHIRENMDCSQLSQALFLDWLRMMPVLADKVKIEAGFASDSTIVLFSLPAALWQYLPRDPAIALIGKIRSSNLIQHAQRSEDGIEDLTIKDKSASILPELLKVFNEHGTMYEDRVFPDDLSEFEKTRIENRNIRSFCSLNQSFINQTNAPNTSSATHKSKDQQRRQPKPDGNAPERPPSAYEIFVNKRRDALKHNFTGINLEKLWKDLDAVSKKRYELQALYAEEKYKVKLAEYRKTIESQKYEKYLKNFNGGQSKQQQQEKMPDLSKDMEERDREKSDKDRHRMEEERKTRRIWKESESAMLLARREVGDEARVREKEYEERWKRRAERRRALEEMEREEAGEKEDEERRKRRAERHRAALGERAALKEGEREKGGYFLETVQRVHSLKYPSFAHVGAKHEPLPGLVSDVSKEGVADDAPIAAQRRAENAASPDPEKIVAGASMKERESTKRVSFEEEANRDNTRSSWAVIDGRYSSFEASKIIPTKLTPPLFFDPERAARLRLKSPRGGGELPIPVTSDFLDLDSVLSDDLGYLLDDYVSELSEHITPAIHLKYFPCPISPTTSDSDFERDLDEWLNEGCPPGTATPSLRGSSPVEASSDPTHSYGLILPVLDR